MQHTGQFFTFTSIHHLNLKFFSIGHPFVTLGIGFKSYVCYRLRLRTQRQIQTENNFYYELLKGSLPSPPQVTQQLAITDKDKSSFFFSQKFHRIY